MNDKGRYGRLVKIISTVIDEVRAGEMSDDINIHGAIEMIEEEFRTKEATNE